MGRASRAPGLEVGRGAVRETLERRRERPGRIRHRVVHGSDDRARRFDEPGASPRLGRANPFVPDDRPGRRVFRSNLVRAGQPAQADLPYPGTPRVHDLVQVQDPPRVAGETRGAQPLEVAVRKFQRRLRIPRQNRRRAVDRAVRHRHAEDGVGCAPNRLPYLRISLEFVVVQSRDAASGVGVDGYERARDGAYRKHDLGTRVRGWRSVANRFGDNPAEPDHAAQRPARDPRARAGLPYFPPDRLIRGEGQRGAGAPRREACRGRSAVRRPPRRLGA